MSAPIIIAIDGYSSCGKSTLAKQLANVLNYKYVDTGAMYRALTLYLLRNQIDIHHPEMVASALPQIHISFGLEPNSQEQFTILNGENIENEIRVNSRVASAVSTVSAQPEVRKFLVKQQQEFGKEKGIVMDGRDIGTVVFPHAELKLFITAEPNIRAQRRLDELQEKNQDTSFEEVLANLQKRDLMDTTRADSPLVKAKDAIEIDNSNLSREEQLNKVLALIKGLNGQSV
ncbi:MAG: (d)CMP kinase [Bacteroidia bacterium]|nr:(d)CMP kinase [Bacteroidia bacterium]